MSNELLIYSVCLLTLLLLFCMGAVAALWVKVLAMERSTHRMYLYDPATGETTPVSGGDGEGFSAPLTDKQKEGMVQTGDYDPID